MLPLRLELKNFLPYRLPDPLLFEGIHLACLTGHNGAGKSSLLDAITWALWGKSRAKRDEDLMHQGQNEMSVQLDFDQEGATYRVIRQRKGGKKGFGTLYLFAMQPDGQWRTLNEPSVRATQDRIEQLLRLDYETFIASAYLQQGKADNFTMKPPAERKRILGEILGLARWSVYEDRAKTKITEIDREMHTISGAIAAADEEIRKEPQYLRDKTAAETAYHEAQKALGIAEQQLAEIAHASTDLRNKQEQLAAQQQRRRELLLEDKTVADDIAIRHNNIARYQSMLDAGDTIVAGYMALQQARETDSTLGAKLGRLSDLEKEIHAFELQLGSERAELGKQRISYETTIAENTRIIQLANPDELAQVQASISEIEALEQQREKLYAHITRLKEEKSALNATRSALTLEGKNLNERLEKLQQTEGATCPLCGQPLTPEHRDELLAELTIERDDKRNTYSQSQQRIKTIGDETSDLEKQMETLAESIKQLPPLRSRAGALQKQLDDAHAAQQRLDEAQAHLHVIIAVLTEETFLPEIREQLTQLQQERAAIGYDRETHNSARANLEQYRDYEAQHTQLEIARNALPGEQLALENALARQARITGALAEEDARITDSNAEIARLKLLVEEQHRRETEVARQRTLERSAHERLITVQQQLLAVERQRKRKADLELRREEKKAEKDLYEELKKAFGKNGVPLMIIETAIPELETAANELLGRMTDGRMTLRLMTQREKVSGGAADALDIEIADELGTRPYEMYSGGEAFRINFALRIALSKMLARRAGAHLRTLFIDEGFGTQDDDGRNKLVEAINTIQGDFDMILVITHIDELRDAFPVHIVIEKTGSGSMIAVR